MATIFRPMNTGDHPHWVWYLLNINIHGDPEQYLNLADFWRVPVVAPALMRCSEVYFALAEAKLAGLLPAGFAAQLKSIIRKGSMHPSTGINGSMI